MIKEFIYMLAKATWMKERQDLQNRIHNQKKHIRNLERRLKDYDFWILRDVDYDKQEKD